MRIISSFLLVIFLALTADAAYVVLKDGKKGRIDIPDSSELYKSTLDSFHAGNKNGNYNLLKLNVEYLVIESDTLRFIGNVAQRVSLVQNNETPAADELPAPLKTGDSEIVGDQNIDEAEVESPDRTIVIGVDNAKNNLHLKTEMESNQKVAIHGLVVYCLSMGLQYGVALPLSISAVNNQDEGLAVGSLIVSAIAGGMSISGSTRCGVGASLTYDTGRKYQLGLDKNINWGFYRAGWALKAAYSVMYVLASTDKSLAQALGLPAMIVDFVSTGMFLTSVANSSHYSRTGLNKVNHASLKIDLVPVVSVENKCAGMVLNCSF
jgi:hypothetical protein